MVVQLSLYYLTFHITIISLLQKYHYSLGMSLYSTTKENLVGDIIFSIADQIKHGIGILADENPEFQIDIAKFYELSGMKAVACSDHATSRSYLTYALALLPTDHWKSQYDLSLRFSLRLAKSCYSCGDLEKAHSILGETITHCHSIEDKLPGNALLARSESHHVRSIFLRETFLMFLLLSFLCPVQFILIVTVSWKHTQSATRPYPNSARKYRNHCKAAKFPKCLKQHQTC